MSVRYSRLDTGEWGVRATGEDSWDRFTGLAFAHGDEVELQVTKRTGSSKWHRLRCVSSNPDASGGNVALFEIMRDLQPQTHDELRALEDVQGSRRDTFEEYLDLPVEYS